PFIIDPNLSVEAAYMEYVAETTDGELIAGVLTYDGPDSITLSNSGGNESIRRDELESLRSTGRSPMPTGFELLGPEAIRDVLAFLCQDYEDFRIVSLEDYFCASTSKGLYDRRYDAHGMRFDKFGVVDVLGIPMELFDPAAMTNSNNAVVLKGGAREDWQSKTLMPQQVDIPIGFAFQRMHVLGGISAWGHPFFGEHDPAVQWTFHYADGTQEVHLLKDGVEFADWIGRHEVPGSEYVEGLLQAGSVGQLRTFSIDPKRTDVVVERLTLESFDNRTAPTFLSLTAQVHGAEARQPKAEPIPTYPELLIVGGGSSHDYPRWFDEQLRSTLQSSNNFDAAKIEYTDQLDLVLPRLATLEVLLLSNNQAVHGSDLRKGVFDFVQRGGGLFLMHAATWYNWADWPEYNRLLVSGGARGHEAYGVFDVKRSEIDHPVLEGIPLMFPLADELYRFERDPDGAPIEVLATGVSGVSGQSYPVLWITDSGSGRILCTTLGHDGAAHEHPAFQRLVQNAAAWLARK
ncbi:MAG: type 1 glutamine amidotransferase, partial [Candidatus Paceibacteria bacterium]